MFEKAIKKFENEYIAGEWEKEITENCKNLTREELISRYTKLHKESYIIEPFGKELFTAAVFYLFYFHPDWDGTEYSDEKGEQIVMRLINNEPL